MHDLNAAADNELATTRAWPGLVSSALLAFAALLAAILLPTTAGAQEPECGDADQATLAILDYDAELTDANVVIKTDEHGVVAVLVTGDWMGLDVGVISVRSENLSHYTTFGLARWPSGSVLAYGLALGHHGNFDGCTASAEMGTALVVSGGLYLTKTAISATDAG